MSDYTCPECRKHGITEPPTITPTSSPTNDFETREETGLDPVEHDNHVAYGFVVVLTALGIVVAGVVLMVVNAGNLTH